jgi:5-methyltetrahydropteroyltriglutamate--homocysteine methyltransferase
MGARRAYKGKIRCHRQGCDCGYDSAFLGYRSPVVTDGEQNKPSFATYPIHGATNLAPDGIVILFEDGHTRQLPRLTSGPFRYITYADNHLAAAKKMTKLPIKQAVISASALSLLYTEPGVPGYSKEEFFADLISEAEQDIRRCLQSGASVVQIDFTEGRLALKLDPSGQLLKQFIDLNNRVLARFSQEGKLKIGVHSCPGGDRDATHSAGVDYASLLPQLF